MWAGRDLNTICAAENAQKRGKTSDEHPLTKQENTGGYVAERTIASVVAPTVASVDAIETALAFALTEAAKAGRFDVVAQLAKELEARRLASSPNVVALDSARARQ
jgi:hypothetical protein